MPAQRSPDARGILAGVTVFDKRCIAKVRAELVLRIRRVCPDMPEREFNELIDDMMHVHLNDEKLRKRDRWASRTDHIVRMLHFSRGAS